MQKSKITSNKGAKIYKVFAPLFFETSTNIKIADVDSLPKQKLGHPFLYECDRHLK